MSNQERRQQIIDTAADLFDKTGYSYTSMDDIAQAIGVAKPTLYHYFQSKHEILHTINEELIDMLTSRHEQRLGAGLAPEQLLLEAMADILELMDTHRGHVRVFLEHHRELPPAAQGPMKAKRDHYEGMVEAIFVDGMRSGVFRTVDAHLATLGVLGMCNWVYQWFSSSGPLGSREIAYQFWSFFVYGVGSPPMQLP
jgi:AcrR family transcriptional regulator